MAIQLVTGNDYLTRTTGLLSPASDSTVMFWVKVDGVIAAYQPLYTLVDNPAVFNQYDEIWLSNPNPFGTNAGLTLMNQVALSPPYSGLDGVDPLGVGTYRHIAKVQSGTTHRVYINGVLWSAYRHSTGGVGDGAGQTSFTLDFSTAVVGHEYLGGDGTVNEGNLDVAYVREWTAALTQAQIQTEMFSSVAVKTTGLYMDCPLVSDLLDDSGNGHDWTQVGSGSFVAGPTLLPNTDATTASVITLPYSVTLKAQTGTALNPHVWFTYTAVGGDVVIGTWAFTSLASTAKPTVKVWFGTATALTSLGTIVDLNITAANVPYSVPITPGTQYFFEVRNAGLDDATTADLTFSAVPQPTDTIQRGDIMVNDETFGFPVVAMQSNSGTVKRHKVFSSGESADIQPDGTVLAEALDFNGNVIGLQRWDADFVLQATIAYPGSFDEVYHIYTSPLGGWWISGHLTNTTTTVVKMDVSGSFVGTTYTITHSSTTQPVGIAVNSDETILYYAVTGAANAAIQRWDLVNNVALADFVAGIATFTVLQDLIVLSDDTVIIGHKKLTAVRDNNVHHYAADGSLLDTYAFGGGMFLNRMCRALDDPISFWVWIYPGDATTGVRNGTNRYVNVVVADGSFAADETVAFFERGVYSAAASATPTARFGPSFSCPMWIYTVSVPTPTGEPTEYLIRRERWFPHLNNEQMRQFFSFLQIDLQAGNGITTGQGSDPILEIDWSDDGGWTWSSIRFVKTGKIGAYTQRAITRRMGYSRDRTYRIAVSDPNQWVVINGYLQAVLGTS